MNRSYAELNDEHLDELLNSTHFIRAPDDFVANVMQSIHGESDPVTQSNDDTASMHPWWQWLALLIAGGPGIAQVVALIFSAWQISSAG
ncbi:MAG: hypothetical protein ACPGVP_05270 [Thiolinea sp.]